MVQDGVLVEQYGVGDASPSILVDGAAWNSDECLPGRSGHCVDMAASPAEEEYYVKGITRVIGRVPFFGGSTADDAIAGDWNLYTSDEVFPDGVAVVFFYTDKPMVFLVGAVGYFLVGFALQMGGSGGAATLGDGGSSLGSMIEKCRIRNTASQRNDACHFAMF